MQAFLAGRKTRTRRKWSEDYARRFRPGTLCQAWDHVPRVKGARRIGWLRIVGIKRENVSEMPDADFEREGFAFMEDNGLSIQGKQPKQAFEDWRREGGEFWVVDFERVDGKAASP